MAKTEWREFQDRVAEMEPLLNRAGAEVESPGWILDKDTGQPREVDVLVRLPYAAKPIVVTIECRKHRSKQDVRWIEQLAQKRESIQADRIVAVSQSSFTWPAKSKAQQLGIELRTLSELDADKILGDAYSLLFCFERRNCDNPHFEIECGPILEGPSSVAPPIPAALARAVAEQDLTTPLFFDTANGKKMSLWEIWRNVLWDPIFVGLVPGDPAQRRTANVSLPGPTLSFLSESDPPFYLWAMSVTADFSTERVTLRPSACYEYRGEDGVLLRRLEWDLDALGQPGTAIIDVLPPEPDGGMPLAPMFRQRSGSPAHLSFRLEHDPL